MQITRQRAYARAGFIGNPSDGYHGKTIAFTINNFFAEVVLYEWPTVEIVWSKDDQSRFRSIKELVDDVELHGYYGGVRLIKATIKRFYEYCSRKQIELHDRNFSIRYSTNIPRAVGMAGSSAIIVATLRALMSFYNIELSLRLQPSLALSVETMELGIAAGLQDRVVQVYEGLVAMDFSPDVMVIDDDMECGKYEPLDSSLLKSTYVAYSHEMGEPTYVVHNPLRTRYQNGDSEVINAMHALADLTDEARSAIEAGDVQKLHQYVNQNFEIRKSICNISAHHQSMVDAARSVGASAKFAGSGGAIVGTYQDEMMFEKLKAALGRIRCEVVKPMA